MALGDTERGKLGRDDAQGKLAEEVGRHAAVPLALVFRILSVIAGALLIMASSHAAGSAILYSCPAAQPEPGKEQGALSRVVTQADGSRLRLAVSNATPPGCRGVALPVSPDEVAALHPISPTAAAALGDALLLHGPKKDGDFSIGSVSGTAAAPPRQDAITPIPLDENLLAGLSARGFGVEERVRVQLSDGKLRMQCAPGRRPAGVILSAPWIMTQASADLRLTASGNGRHEVQVQDAAGAASGSAVRLGYLDAAAAARGQRLELPRAGFDRMRWKSFSIACPLEASELAIDDMRLLPRALPGAQVPGRATWIWRADDWREPAQAFAHAERHGIRTMFVAVPLTEDKGEFRVAEAAQLAAFIGEATRRGIDVWSVDGDPYMVLPREHAATVQRVRAYAAYNRSVAPQARLRGLQFDIEHYLVAGYELSAPALDRQYAALVEALHRAAAGLPLEFVVPFWWSDKADLLKSLAKHAYGLTVMDYRTDPGQILRFGAPFLDWAAMHGKRVRIALEAGPVDAEWQRRYVKAAGGELWVVRLDKMPVLVLLKRMHDAPPGAQAFRFASERLLDGSATSFHGNPARMLSLLPALEAGFSAWPGFGGMALHELK
ncbi:hypothetical protein RY831_10490 [Noviherbaspirillum sp. CPCC 100848]|uniref:DUF4434 domain-containing protein n=1 Tax=Noviherbaspirillum album TaxID=3080276 RepID=A0ABU6J7S3_9BURK|nr:hypothetical protein [Noviherbaspirillum sp. CPCC 100848]MEC4719580.1 hypothetical protein [Noviherbaspirillum sp. CPCC 100848]